MDIEPGERAPAEAEPTPEEGSAVDETVEGEDRKTADARRAMAEEAIVVETRLYRMEMTNRGARIVSFRLFEHRDSHGEPYELISHAAAEQLDVQPLDVRVDSQRAEVALKEALFEVEGSRHISLEDGEKATVAFSWSDGEELEAEKTLTVVGGTYRIGVTLSVRESGREVAKSLIYGAGIGTEPSASRYVGQEKGVVAAGGTVELFSASDIEDGEGGGLGVVATGVASHYFAGLMVPAPAKSGSYGARLEEATIRVAAKRESAEGDGAQGGKAAASTTDRDVITALLVTPPEVGELTLYIGPKKWERLHALAPGMENIIEFGSWMRYPALLLRAGLVAIYERVGNYGWAIVLLTVVINLFLVPLKHYSFVSMRKMQKIAPQMQKIRERYKKVKPTDPRYQEMNQEIMALQKKHGVNPISGCLPMLLMIPFFFAFYRLLMASVELRQAPFVFWIQDLSAHDPLYVLPILMGATQVGIQKMTPQTSADPIQTKIMSFMPVMFTLILLWAPSGLVLYWFSNNLVSMLQQTVTNRLLKDREEQTAEMEKVKASPKTVKKGAKNTKSGKKR